MFSSPRAPRGSIFRVLTKRLVLYRISVSAFVSFRLPRFSFAVCRSLSLFVSHVSISAVFDLSRALKLRFCPSHPRVLPANFEYYRVPYYHPLSATHSLRTHCHASSYPNTLLGVLRGTFFCLAPYASHLLRLVCPGRDASTPLADPELSLECKRRCSQPGSCFVVVRFP